MSIKKFFLKKNIREKFAIATSIFFCHILCLFTEYDFQVFAIFLWAISFAQLSLYSLPKVEYSQLAVFPISYRRKFFRVTKKIYWNPYLLIFTLLFHVENPLLLEICLYIFAYLFVFHTNSITAVILSREGIKNKLLYLVVNLLLFGIIPMYYATMRPRTEEGIATIIETENAYVRNIENLAFAFAILALLSFLSSYFLHRRTIQKHPFLSRQPIQLFNNEE
jgi:hypothetical protein